MRYACRSFGLWIEANCQTPLLVTGDDLCSCHLLARRGGSDFFTLCYHDTTMPSHEKHETRHPRALDLVFSLPPSDVLLNFGSLEKRERTEQK